MKPFVAASALTSWEQVSAIIAASTIITGALWRGVGRPVVKLFERIFDRLDTLGKDVAVLKREMEPNGGSSLRDSNNRIEAVQRLQSDRLANLETHLLGQPNDEPKATT